MRRLFKWVFLAVVSLSALVILFTGLLFALVVAILSLLTGRKPAIFTTLSRVRAFSEQVRAGSFGAPGTHAAANDDVVDVQAREVRPELGTTSPPRPQSGE